MSCQEQLCGPDEEYYYMLQPLPPGLPEGFRGVRRSAERHSLSSVSVSGSLPSGACPEQLPRETSRRHPKQMPKPPQLASPEAQSLIATLCCRDVSAKTAPQHPENSGRILSIPSASPLRSC